AQLLRGDEPAGEQLQASGARLRGARERRLVAPQPVADDPRACATGEGDAAGAADAGPVREPVPGARGPARGRAGWRTTKDGAAGAGRQEHLGPERARAPQVPDPGAAARFG